MGDESARTASHAREIFKRSEKALKLRPSLGHKTVRSKTTLRDGFVCEIEEGRWTLTSDLGEKGGGTGKGPDPGVLIRAALGSCLAMAYYQWAARHEITLSSLVVEIEGEFDAGGQYGVSDAPPGYSRLRYTTRVESPDPADRVREVLEQAERHTPNLDVFTRVQPVEGELVITPVGEGE